MGAISLSREAGHCWRKRRRADGVLRVFVVNGIEPVQCRVAFFRRRTRRGQAGNGLAGIFFIASQQFAGNI